MDFRTNTQYLQIQDRIGTSFTLIVRTYFSNVNES